MTIETDLAITRPFTATASNASQYSFDFAFNQERQDDVIAGLNAWNKSHSPNWNNNNDGRFTVEQISLYVLDMEGKLIGGLLGQTHSVREWFAVNVLFVDEQSRGRG